MKNTRARILTSVVILAGFVSLLASIAEAHEEGIVNCDLHGDPPHRDSLQAAINNSFPGGATIFVTGTCNENNIFIGGNRANLTLDGLPLGAATRATISSQTPPGTPLINTNATLIVNGASNVRIGNFIITGNGTADGPNIQDGANVRLSDSIIENVFREGVFVRAASARIFGNTIRNNGGDGIVVTENSALRIGFFSTDEGIVRPNTIQGNAGNGISLRSSTARILGNTTTISGNGGHGISVFKGSHADIASNDISGNGGDGISVRDNSGVNLGSTVSDGVTNVPPVSPVFTQPNTTTEPNAGFGIRCSIGGYASGEIGTLNGTAGVRSFDKTCIDALPKK